MAMSRKLAGVLLAAVFLSTIPASAQKKGTAWFWLTTPDRSSLLAKQAPLRFEKADVAGLPVIEVDGGRKFQRMDGFGFALTGGSAQLLMRMDAPQRRALLQELFGTGAHDIGASYLRVSIGSSDMNDHA